MKSEKMLKCADQRTKKRYGKRRSTQSSIKSSIYIAKCFELEELSARNFIDINEFQIFKTSYIFQQNFIIFIIEVGANYLLTYIPYFGNNYLLINILLSNFYRFEL